MEEGLTPSKTLHRSYIADISRMQRTWRRTVGSKRRFPFSQIAGIFMRYLFGHAQRKRTLNLHSYQQNSPVHCRALPPQRLLTHKDYEACTLSQGQCRYLSWLSVVVARSSKLAGHASTSYMAACTIQRIEKLSTVRSELSS